MCALVWFKYKNHLVRVRASPTCARGEGKLLLMISSSWLDDARLAPSVTLAGCLRPPVWWLQSRNAQSAVVRKVQVHHFWFLGAWIMATHYWCWWGVKDWLFMESTLIFAACSPRLFWLKRAASCSTACLRTDLSPSWIKQCEELLCWQTLRQVTGRSLEVRPLV